MEKNITIGHIKLIVKTMNILQLKILILILINLRFSNIIYFAK